MNLKESATSLKLVLHHSARSFVFWSLYFFMLTRGTSWSDYLETHTSFITSRSFSNLRDLTFPLTFKRHVLLLKTFNKNHKQILARINDIHRSAGKHIYEWFKIDLVPITVSLNIMVFNNIPRIRSYTWYNAWDQCSITFFQYHCASNTKTGM